MRQSSIFLLAWLVAGCSSDGGGNVPVDLATAAPPDAAMSRDLSTGPDLATAPLGATVILKDDFYMPSMVTISAGQRIKWTWQAAGAHGVDSIDNAFPDGPIFMQNGASTYEHTFTTPGTYKVQCLVHGSAMPSTIVVK